VVTLLARRIGRKPIPLRTQRNDYGHNGSAFDSALTGPKKANAARTSPLRPAWLVGRTLDRHLCCLRSLFFNDRSGDCWWTFRTEQPAKGPSERKFGRLRRSKGGSGGDGRVATLVESLGGRHCPFFPAASDTQSCENADELYDESMGED
jgi:hypothetical protein